MALMTFRVDSGPREVILSCDPEQELKQLWKTGIKEGLWASSFGHRHLPSFNLRRSRTRSYTTGRAWGRQHRIVVTLGNGGGIGDLLGVVAHEVAHLLLPWGVHHSPEYWACLCSLVKFRWGITVDLTQFGNHVKRQREINTEVGAHLLLQDSNWISNNLLLAQVAE